MAEDETLDARLQDIQDDRLRDIEARVQHATEGPWGHDVHGDTVMDKPALKRGIGYTAFAADAHGVVTSDIDANNRDADLAFIAHARVDVPWLLTLLGERDAEIAALKEKTDA